MTDDRERWALILGGSSGMGEATAITLAKAGTYKYFCNIHNYMTGTIEVK